ncbi:MAG: tRNA (guanosine(37)-N1)-methyltransferase TrmD [Megasphaera sp.]|jgi:tRNA (guanine37-N1)-methyltransferase|nr:tRNA (guanosine(37)-N1)-methyltransferase TrmD [Megasphaera sp.]MCH4187416.1 tRNA (guanosine(37)-N1)-methyltransferase TrmD [Megasphaera sp.]MCH4217335.1 tRNA (guanosine(37)-N1)-methyltransferase TrmD [Megasphaera sp.]
MRIDIISLFPEFIEAFFSHSIIGRARAAGLLELDVTNPRNFTYDRHHMVDDTIYGGGCGMLMKAAPLYAAVESVRRSVPKRRIILMGPAGQTFDQAKAKELAGYDQLILLCGHYEGVDYRVETDLVDETISIGDYVLTGGEIPAMAVSDAVARMIPGVLAAGSAAGDSFYSQLLEYPQYTKPAVFRHMDVPEVLRNGDHKKIDEWRHAASLARTLTKRPDLLSSAVLSEGDKELLLQLKQEGKL